MVDTCDSYSEANGNEDIPINNSTYTMRGQSFTGNGGTLDSAQFYMKKTGSPTGSVYAKIYSHSGTFGSTGIPSSLLATSDAYDVSTLTTSNGLRTFSFSDAARITLTNETKYFLVFSSIGVGDASNTASCMRDNSSPTHSGNAAYYSTSWTGNYSANDFCFYVFTEAVASTATSINIGDTWKEIVWTDCSINIGDTWKDIVGVSINIGDTWKTVAGSP